MVRAPCSTPYKIRPMETEDLVPHPSASNIIKLLVTPLDNTNLVVPLGKGFIWMSVRKIWNLCSYRIYGSDSVI